MTLHYRGSTDGWMAEDFHRLCDNKGPTLTLLQIQDGDCIGGFTNHSWSSPDKSEYKTDSSAFIFNLTRPTSFPCLDHERAINCWKYSGPVFGNYELLVLHEPFNQPNACWSMPNKDGYKIPVNSEGINMLTNKKCDDGDVSEFTISSLEVWGVTLKD